MSSWTAFAFLIITAVVYYYIGKLVLILVAAYFLFRAWLWIGWHYPAVTWFLIGFFRGLR